MMVTKNTDDDERWAKCDRCGESITKSQYEGGNYNGHNGKEETHVRCPKGWRGRALERIAQANILQATPKVEEEKQSIEKQKQEQKTLEEQFKDEVVGWLRKKQPCSHTALTDMFVGTMKQPIMWALLELAEEGRIVLDEGGKWCARN